MLSTTTTERKPDVDTNDQTQRLTQKVRLVGSTAYQYRNLKEKEFRLLLLGPGRRCSRLSASLEHASLDDAIRPQYETISYTWGDATARAKIKIDGKKLHIPDFRQVLSPGGRQAPLSPGAHQLSLHQQKILHNLYSRPWFSRLWILQEAALSPFNVCLYGKHTISLFDLLTTAWYIYLNCRLQSNFLKAFYNATCVFHVVYQGYSEYTRHTGMKRELGSLLQVSCRAVASIPHDHVFALLGLIRLDNAAELRRSRDGVDIIGVLMSPDYTKTAAEVFSDASRAALIIEQTMTQLFGVDHRNEASVVGRDLPSWVLDLRMNERSDQRSASRFDHNYHAAHGSPKQKLSCKPSSTLTVRGRVLDDVLEVGPVRPDDVAWLQTSTFFRASAQVARCAPLVDTVENALGDEHMKALQIFARTLVAGMCRGERHCTNINTHQELLNIFESDGHSPDGGAAAAYMSPTDLCCGRRVFRIRVGSVGLGPRFMQEQDKIVIFYQARMPCIIRPAEYEGYFHFVGNCYVDGIMDGEVYAGSGATSDPVRDQWFHLW